MLTDGLPGENKNGKTDDTVDKNLNKDTQTSTESTWDGSPRAVMTKDGLMLQDPELIDKANNVRISNSLITAMLQCPARFAAEKWITHDLIPEDPLSANVLGSAFHKVMEIFYGYPPADRTIENMRRAYKAALDTEEFEAVKENSDARKWVKDRINGYWRMGLEDPEEVHVAQVEREGKWGKYTRMGLELWIQDTLGNSTRTTGGFIDRLTITEDGKYMIDDWKTGKKAKVFDPSDKYADFGYVRQQVLYAIILENTDDREVAGARLIYPETIHKNKFGEEEEGGFVDEIPIHNEAYRKQAIKDVETVDSMITSCLDRNTWDAEPSPLCSWCPLVNICPAALKIKKANAVASRENQPTAEFLKTGGLVGE